MVATQQFPVILEPSVQDKTKLNSLAEEILGGGEGGVEERFFGFLF